jgi:hypothetical protein
MVQHSKSLHPNVHTHAHEHVINMKIEIEMDMTMDMDKNMTMNEYHQEKGPALACCTQQPPNLSKISFIARHCPKNKIFP